MVFYLDIYRQFFVIHNNGNVLPAKVRDVIIDFYLQFKVVNVLRDFRRPKAKPRVQTQWYASATKDLTEFRFNINTIRNFVQHLKANNVSPDCVAIRRFSVGETYPLGVPLKKGMKPRDYQVPQIEYLVEKDYPTKLLDMQTGKGKTFTALAGITKLNKRTFIFILPKYMDKWISDLQANTGATDEDICVVRGGAALRDYQIMCEEAPEQIPPFTIASNRTILQMIKEYEETGYDPNQYSYPLTPQEMFDKLKAGVLLIDEVHQHFAGCMKVSLYANVDTIIGCSATLESGDSRVASMYRLLFPTDHRAPAIEYDKYIDVYPVAYQIAFKHKIKFQGFGGVYSHTAYEKSIMRNRKLLESYLRMVYNYVKIGYLERRDKGEKCVVFAATVRMCTLITKYLNANCKGLKVKRYVEDDPLENILTADIGVTTLQSGGTAIDIPGLITCVQTIAVESIQANKQSLGRLRKIPGKEVRFYYLYNKKIPSHVKYHKLRMEKWRPLVAGFYQKSYFELLG